MLAVVGLNSLIYIVYIRKLIVDLFHVACIEKMCSSLPKHTASAGFSCPICKTAIMPPAIDVSLTAKRIRGIFGASSWAQHLPAITQSSHSHSHHQGIAENSGIAASSARSSTVRISMDPDDSRYKNKSQTNFDITNYM